MPCIFTFLSRSVLSLLLAVFFISATRAHTPPKTEPVYEKSLEFIQNRNQLDPAVKFNATLPAGQLYLKSNQWVFSFLDQADFSKSDPHNHFEGGVTSEVLHGHTYTVSFLGANPQTEVKGNKQTPGYRNYFLGDDPKQWASSVPAFEVVHYQNLYPGIDAQLYENRQKLKYDFILQPKADPGLIKMEYMGAENVRLDQGNLVIKTSVNTVTEQKPYAYQVIAGKKTEVPCRFKLKGNMLSFEFPKGYRRNLPLVIDPTLVFSSYTGSILDNWGCTATYDEDGNIYSGGLVRNVWPGTFPVTPGAFKTSFTGIINMAIMKFNPNASGPTSRVWATYLGGSRIDAPHSIVVNNRNELLVLGSTSSNNYPTTTNAFDRSYNGGTPVNPYNNTAASSINFGFFGYNPGSDLVISKLSAGGDALLSSTYLGGSGNDGLLRLSSPLTRNYGDQFRGDIQIDVNDNVYIASSTNSQDFPLSKPFQVNHAGSATDAVVCKLSPDLSSLVWSSYLGGNGHDAAYSVQIDTQFNVFICGGTTSNNLPQTAGAFKPAYSAGQNEPDGFASKIDMNGNLVRTTYIGASGSYDQAYFLQLDGQNNVYLLGQTAGNYPATPGVFSTPVGRQFIQKLNSNLTTGIFSTRFGSADGQFNISPTAFLVDNCERIFVCGWGGEINHQEPDYVQGSTAGLPVTANAIKPSTDGSDFYLMQLSQNATQLDYASFLGGSVPEHVDGGTSRFDKRGFVYQAVCAGCGGNNAFPTTPNAWSTTNGTANNPDRNRRNCNNAAVKFDFAVSAAVTGTTQQACLNAAPFTIAGTPSGGTWSGPGVTSGGVFDPAVAGLGSHALTYTVVVGTCQSTANKVITVVTQPAVNFSGLKNDKYCLSDKPVLLVPSTPGGTFNGPGIQTGNLWSPEAAGPGRHVITYSFTDKNSCTATATDTVEVETPIPVSAGPNEGVCAGTAPFTLAGMSPTGGTWSGDGVTSNGVFAPASVGVGRHTLTYSVVTGNCTYKATKIIEIEPTAEIQTVLPYPNCNSADSLIAGYTPLKINFKNNFPLGKNYHWDFGDGTISTEENPEHVYTEEGTYSVQLTTDFGRECVRSYSVSQLRVVKSIIPNIITPNGDGKNDTFVPKVTCLPQTLKIYSRWGHLVYERENYQDEFNSDNLSSGVYYYHLRDTEGKNWKGWLEIIK
ncbi:DUF7948 domain-containing protein [Adhaeribacter soli]|nr:gliding motility-associated C-terminal domain-containing protein [Adhaeribacter soli]